MQVFDLTRLRDFDGEPTTFESDAHYDRIASAHNIVINEETGYAYSVGSSTAGESCGGGLHMIDVRDPQNPTFAGCFSDPQTGRASTGYSHDAQCVVYEGPDEEYQGREICLGSNETALSIADVTDKANPVAVSRATYPNVGYSHQGWLTEDHRFFYMNDELDELQGLTSATRTLVWDLEDLDDPQLIAEHMGTTESSDHNLYILGDRMYQSNYQSGLRILDISDPANPEEVAYFDTVPYGTNTPGFGGSWSNYPYFESGMVIVTSGNEGLFIVKPRDERTIS
jgi:choice-of-anchor B domain-containing protein